MFSCSYQQLKWPWFIQRAQQRKKLHPENAVELKYLNFLVVQTPNMLCMMLTNKTTSLLVGSNLQEFFVFLSRLV